jgi:hypothetical protein
VIVVDNIIYEEDVFSRDIVFISVIFTVIFSAAFIYQTFIGPLGSDPAPNMFYLIMVLIFGVLLVNFHHIQIKITTDYIFAKYGFFKYQISFDEVTNYHLDKSSSFFYGGYGIRVRRKDGKWRVVFTTIGRERIVLDAKGHLFGSFGFSTTNPEEVIKIIKKRVENKT